MLIFEQPFSVALSCIDRHRSRCSQVAEILDLNDSNFAWAFL